MIKRMLPFLVLALAACESEAPIGAESAAFSTRDPIMHGVDILQWQAVDATHVYVLDSGRTLHYGDGNTWQTVQTSVLWFGVSAYSSTIWIRDFQGTLYPWSLGRTPTGVAAAPIAYFTKQAKASSEDGSVFWIGSDNYLYGSAMPSSRIDTNVQSFFPAGSQWVDDIGTDGKLWQWGVNANNAWVRQYMDGSAALAEPGCFANQPNGTCHTYVLGSDGKLWTESNETGGHGSSYVDANVWQFEGTGGNFVFVAGRDENLWREDGSYQHRDFVDGNVSNFQTAGNTTVWVQGTDGNLWREHLSGNLP